VVRPIAAVETFGQGGSLRGNPPSSGVHSGFIGLQTHTGAVAFANVRIRTI